MILDDYVCLCLLQKRRTSLWPLGLTTINLFPLDAHSSTPRSCKYRWRRTGHTNEFHLHMCNCICSLSTHGLSTLPPQPLHPITHTEQLTLSGPADVLSRITPDGLRSWPNSASPAANFSHVFRSHTRSSRNVGKRD